MALVHKDQYIIEQCETYAAQCNLDGVHPTITGLAMHLGCPSVEYMYNLMARNEEVQYSIQRALLEVEHFAEKGLMCKETSFGSKFVLERLGWQTKVLQVNVQNSITMTDYDLHVVPDSVLKAQYKILRGSTPQNALTTQEDFSQLFAEM